MSRYISSVLETQFLVISLLVFIEWKEFHDGIRVAGHGLHAPYMFPLLFLLLNLSVDLLIYGLVRLWQFKCKNASATKPQIR